MAHLVNFKLANSNLLAIISRGEAGVAVVAQYYYLPSTEQLHANEPTTFTFTFIFAIPSIISAEKHVSLLCYQKYTPPIHLHVVHLCRVISLAPSQHGFLLISTDSDTNSPPALNQARLLRAVSIAH